MNAIADPAAPAVQVLTVATLAMRCGRVTAAITTGQQLLLAEVGS